MNELLRNFMKGWFTSADVYRSIRQCPHIFAGDVYKCSDQKKRADWLQWLTEAGIDPAILRVLSRAN